MDKSEAKTRGVLRRTRENYLRNPTQGRLSAIQRYERSLQQREFIRLVEQNPDARMTMREILQYLL